MATVTVYRGGVEAVPVTRQRQQAFTAPDGVGEGLQTLGRSLGQFAQAKDAYQARVDEATANTLDADFSEAVREIERGYLSTKGMNAVDQAKAATEAWEKTEQSFQARATNPRQQQMLAGVLSRRKARWQSQYDSHLTTQTDVWADDAEKSRISTMSVDVVDLPVGSEERLEAIMGLGAVLKERGRRLGWDAATQQAEGMAVFSTIHENTVSALVEDARPHEAMTYLEENRETINPDKFTTLKGRVREQVDNFDGRAFALRQNYGAGGEAVTVATDALWEAQKTQESGNRQFDRAGRVITSSAGAFGVAQLMPDTAAYIAQAMGDPSLAEKARTDPAVNERMGKWYMNQQMAKYGLPSLALAAYNAGPGRVDKWLVTIGDPRRGDITEAEWAARIPFNETRGYVANIMRAAGSSSAGVQQVVPQSVALARAREAAGDDPRRQAAFEAAVMGQRRIFEADRNDTRSAAREAIQKYLPNGSAPVATWTDIPEREWNALDPEYQNQIRGTFAAQAAGADKVETDEEVYGALNRMAQLNPQALASLDLTQFSDGLSREDMRRVQGWQLDARVDPNGKKSPVGLAMQSARPQIERLAAAAKMQTDPALMTQDDYRRLNELNRHVEGAVNAFIQSSDGRLPTEEQVASWAAIALRQTRTTEPAWGPLGAMGLTRPVTGLAFEQPGETVVPPEAQARIRQVYRDAGRGNPTPEQIREAYMVGLRTGRFANETVAPGARR